MMFLLSVDEGFIATTKDLKSFSFLLGNWAYKIIFKTREES